MIKDLIRSIMRENVIESEEELMADNANSDIRDAFIGEDGEFDDTTDVTDAKIKDLIKNLPESNSNITSEEISELSESYLDVFEDSDYALESSVSIDSKISKCENVIESLTYKDSLTDNEKQELKEAKRQLSVLTMVKESQSEDLDMDTLDDSETIDVDECGDNEAVSEESLYADDEPIHDKYNPKKDGSAGVNGKDKYADDEWINDVGVDEGDEIDLSDNMDDKTKVKPDEEEGNAMTLDITEAFDDFDIDLESNETDIIDDENEDGNDDVLESYYDGDVTLALEGARMRYLEELDKKQRPILEEIRKLNKEKKSASEDRKKEIDEKLEKLKKERNDISREASKYSGHPAVAPEGATPLKGEKMLVYHQIKATKQASKPTEYGRQSDHISDTEGSKNFKKDFGGPSKESFIIDGEEVLFEESLYADDEPIHDKYNPKKDGSAGVNGKDKYADDEWINDVGVDEGDEIDLSDIDDEDFDDEI